MKLLPGLFIFMRMRRRHVHISTYEYVVLDIDLNVYLDSLTLLPIHLCCRSPSILVNRPWLVPTDPRFLCFPRRLMVQCTMQRHETHSRPISSDAARWCCYLSLVTVRSVITTPVDVGPCPLTLLLYTAHSPDVFEKGR